MAFDPKSLTVEMLAYLVEVVRSRPEGRQMATGVAAAARALEWCKWREERDNDPLDMALMMFGSPDKALEWMRKMEPRLRLLAASRTVEVPAGEAGEGLGDDE